MSSGCPTLENRLTPTRAAWLLPASAITGTPIHNASQLVVVPL